MAKNTTFQGNVYRPPDQLNDWLGQRRDKPIDPDLRIVDPHHHLWDNPERGPYDTADLLADIAGNNVVATVFVECHTHYDSGRSPDFAPLGETHYVRDAVRGLSQPASGNLCKGMVGFADLMLGERVTDVLEAHLNESDETFRGVRYSLAWDPVVGPHAYRNPPPGLLSNPAFRAGFGTLGPLGLSFDAWVYYPQLPELFDLASAFPLTTIIVNHFGGPLGVGYHANQPAEFFRRWRGYVRELARLPNIVMKLGGLGMPACGFQFHRATAPASAERLACAWYPYIESCIEAFGTRRCMFESNFPVDRQTLNYTTLWNTFKLATKSYSSDERQDLFSVTASYTYKI
jgi:predicted TIM-barrel fold metal-dependent hydrolase